MSERFRDLLERIVTGDGAQLENLKESFMAESLGEMTPNDDVEITIAKDTLLEAVRALREEALAMADRPPLTPAERADLRQKAEQATPGPFEFDRHEWTVRAPDGRIVFDRSGGPADHEDLRDARYIAAISPDRLLALLDEVERLETEVARLQKSAEAALGLMRFLP